jgi:hypothetical protein
MIVRSRARHTSRWNQNATLNARLQFPQQPSPRLNRPSRKGSAGFVHLIHLRRRPNPAATQGEAELQVPAIVVEISPVQIHLWDANPTLQSIGTSCFSSTNLSSSPSGIFRSFSEASSLVSCEDIVADASDLQEDPESRSVTNQRGARVIS